jgi:ribosomal protein L29
MPMAAEELRDLSDVELKERLRDVRLTIGLLGPQIETRKKRKSRTIKVIRGTVLMAGGFIAATIDPLGLTLVLFGGWDWVEGIADDAKATNKDVAMRRKINELNAELDLIEFELRQRNLIS